RPGRARRGRGRRGRYRALWNQRLDALGTEIARDHRPRAPSYRGALRQGGRWEALSPDGSVFSTGTITAYEPPRTYSTTWARPHLRPPAPAPPRGSSGARTGNERSTSC